VTTTEDRLRDAFRADAETIAPGTIRPAPPRPEPGRRELRRTGSGRTRLPRPLRPRGGRLAGRPGGWDRARPAVAAIAAAAAVAAIVVAATMADNSGEQQPGGLSGLAAPAAPAPRYVLGLSNAGLTVYSTATGRQVGVIAPPSRKLHFMSVAATAPGHYVAAAIPAQGCTLTRLYQVSLTRRGGLARLAPVPGGRIHGQLTAPGFALSAGGGVIGYAASRCGSSPGWAGVIRLATGQSRRWPMTSHGLTGVTMSPDGRTLYFIDTAGFGGDGTVRALPVSAPAGPLTQRARIVLPASSGVDSGSAGGIALADHGRILLGCREIQDTAVLLAYSAATGRELAVLHTWRGVDSAPCTLTTASSGGYLLITDIGTYPWRMRLGSGHARKLPIGRDDDPVGPVAW
jgi:hypothetical protein